jgi:hypothetical protein
MGCDLSIGVPLPDNPVNRPLDNMPRRESRHFDILPAKLLNMRTDLGRKTITHQGHGLQLRKAAPVHLHHFKAKARQLQRVRLALRGQTLMCGHELKHVLVGIVEMFQGTNLLCSK